ncbi:MAG: hypothetical protein WC335_07360 [Candidatus Omnitrophota bacterium]|jgi:hypothetical protein
MKLKNIRPDVLILLVVAGTAAVYFFKLYGETRVLKKIIERLSADSRVAEVMVSGIKPGVAAGKYYTTIKFLEYDTKSRPLQPKYFTFSENIIQFQSLVIRFDDLYVKTGHSLKGKSAYIFMKAFVLKENGAETFVINKASEVPSGYKIEGRRSNYFEKAVWERFWKYALDPRKARQAGIKNAQIEAPGTRFVPGILYTIKIEHDGGLRIDTQPLPSILKSEEIKF